MVVKEKFEGEVIEDGLVFEEIFADSGDGNDTLEDSSDEQEESVGRKH